MKDIKIAYINELQSHKYFLALKEYPRRWKRKQSAVVDVQFCRHRKVYSSLVWNLIFDAINFILVVQSASKHRGKEKNWLFAVFFAGWFASLLVLWEIKR